MKKLKTITHESTVEEKFTIVAFGNSSDDLLKYLDKVELTIGDKIELSAVEPFDHSVIIVPKKRTITLSETAAANLLVAV